MLSNGYFYFKLLKAIIQTFLLLIAVPSDNLSFR